VFDRSSSADPASAGNDPAARPPGLGEQLGRTRKAFFGLIGAHSRLAKAEFSEIADQFKRVVLLAAIALGLLFLAGITLGVGLMLWLGEWLYGSIGWGALNGALLLIAVGAMVLLGIVDMSWKRCGTALLVAAVFAVAVAFIVGLDWNWIGETRFAGFATSFRPVILAVASGAAVLAVLCGVLGGYLGRAKGVALGLILGAVLGALFGLLGAAHPGPRVGAALGLAIGLLAWSIWAAVLVFRHGVDLDALKARFMPTQTIETTKETIEWVRSQMPLARKR
jgi:hypothetical protein